MSKEYLHAVHDSDRCLATILDALDAAELADSTLVIVTDDHGGHGFHHSGSRVEIDRDIPWIVRGPGITAGTTLDMRSNVVWRWGRGRGTRIEEGSTANVIDNYFGGPPGTDLANALIVCTGPATARACSNRPTNVARAYTSGNVLHGSAIDLDARGTEAKPFPAPATATLGACAAAARAVEDAGAQPRDAIDAAYAAAIAACGEQPRRTSADQGPAAPASSR